MLNHKGTKTIETERLILRQFTMDDLDRTDYPTVEIVLADYDYDPEIPEGVIMKQSPEHESEIPLNGKVQVWVSMGPE